MKTGFFSPSIGALPLPWDKVWRRPGWGPGCSLVQRAWGQCFTCIQRVDGLERCPPRKGNLSAPPLGRVEAASCFPAQAGREEPYSQLWAVLSDTVGVSCGSDCGGENGNFLGFERLLLSPLLLGPWDSSGNRCGPSRKLLWLIVSDLTTANTVVNKAYLHITSF